MSPWVVGVGLQLRPRCAGRLRDTSPMPTNFLREDEALREQLLSELAALVTVPRPRLPNPGHQMEFYAAMHGPEPPTRIETRAELAMRRIVDLGVKTDDLYAITRDIVARTIMDVLEVLSPEGGEFAGEFYGLYDELELAPPPH